MPCGTCFRSFFLKVFFLPFLSGAAAPVPVVPAAAGFAIVSSSRRSSVVSLPSSADLSLAPGFLTTKDQRLTTDLKFLPSPSSFARRCPCVDPSGFAHWYASAVLAPAGSGDDDSRDRNRFR